MADELEPTPAQLEELKWSQIAALLLWKLGGDTKIRKVDLERFAKSGKMNMSIRPRGDVVYFELIDNEEARVRTAAAQKPLVEL